MVRPNYFASGEIDRIAHLRRDEDWIRSQLGTPKSRLTLVWRSKSWVMAEEPPRAAFVSADLHASVVEAAEAVVLLGRHQGEVLFAADVSHLEDPADSVDPSGRFVDLRQVGSLLSHWDGSLLAYARAIMTWHQRHRYCGSCGSPTELSQAGHLRICRNPDCALEHFPRTDPAVIMLVTHGDRGLLARQASWPPGVYSALAGFVEPGESLEDAVAREVREETGVVVSEVRYQSSQPWPFPSSLMLGFRATASRDALQIDGEELEDARWFSPRELGDLRQRRELFFPPPVSIARRLIDDWLQGHGREGGRP